MSNPIMSNSITLNSIIDSFLNIASTPLLLAVYGVFLFQIFTLSIYLPTKWRRFRKALFEEHPQSEYPKLYYQPVEVELNRQKIRKNLDYIIGLVALISIFYSLSISASARQVAITMFLLAIVQLAPFWLSQYWGRKNSWLMQNMPQPQLRKSLLAARKITDFVPAIVLPIGILMYITSMTLGLLIYWDIIPLQGQFDQNNWGLLALLILNTLVAVYTAILSNKALFEKRIDQNLSNEDRLFFIRKKIKQLVHTNILYSLFILTLLLSKLIGQGITTIFIATSLYLQLIMLLKVNPRKERDFSVYKADEEIKS